MNVRRLIARSPSAGLALFLLLFGWYVLTTSGHTYTSDEETMLAAGESLVKHGSFALPLDFLMNHRTGVDGEHYSRYGPGLSVMAVPFILVGKLVASIAPHYAGRFILLLFVLLLPALLTAATGCIVYAWVRSLGYDARVGLLVGVLFGTSLAYPYSRTFFAEPATTFFLLLCAYAIRRESWRWWIVAGFAAGCAMAVKLQVLLLLPLVAIYALLVSWRGSWHETGSAILWRTLAGLAGLAVPLGLLLLYNTRIFGHPLETGYGGVDPTYLLEGNWREGVYGLLVSTGKGILLYSPTILVGIVGMFFCLRRQWRESLLALAMLIINVAFYSRLSYWHGDGSWGPRYMVFVLPFVYLPAAGLLHTLLERRMRWGGVVLAVLFGVNLAIQLLPVLVNFNTYIWISNHRSGHYQRLFDPPDSPLIWHPRIWAERASEWWLRVSPPDGVAVLVDGFSYSEGDRSRGDILPRWTYADATVALHPYDAQRSLNGQLVVGDHRPWPLERAQFALLLDGEPLANVQRTDVTGQNIVWDLQFALAPEQVRSGVQITLQSDTWNPEDTTPDNPRDEELGLRVETLEFSQDGRMLELREALPIPTVERDRREMWLWYYDTPKHHLFDTWLWFVFVAGLPARVIVVLLLVLALPALVMLTIGGRGVISVFQVQETSLEA
jgi:hypothetical protein